MSIHPLKHFHYHSPIGIIKISSDEEGILSLDFLDKVVSDENSASRVVKECAQQLDEYFSGKRTSFSVPLKVEGTDFQKRVWKIVYDIPYGKTVTYLDIAVSAGDKNLIRAVGGANGANKIPIIIPCHRVIGVNGKLTGYAGGLWRKKWLLDFEMKKMQPELFAVANEIVHEKV